VPFLYCFSYITADKHVTIVEGVVDALRLHAHGVKNVVSLGGSSLNQSQLNSLINKGVKSITLALDNDLAGKEATQRITKMITDSKAQIELKVLAFPKDVKDPDHLVSNAGISTFNKLVSEAKTISSPSIVKSKDHGLEV